MRPAALVLAGLASAMLFLSAFRDTAIGTFVLNNDVMPSDASDGADGTLDTHLSDTDA